MQINSLRELDKLVAEKIFGWGDFWKSSVSSTGYYYLKGYPPQEQGIGIDAERLVVPRYTTDIAAAWSITEKFYHVKIEKLDDGIYRAFLNPSLATAYVKINIYVRAKTIEIALCLAALKAEGIEVDFE